VQSLRKPSAEIPAARRSVGTTIPRAGTFASLTSAFARTTTSALACAPAALTRCAACPAFPTPAHARCAATAFAACVFYYHGNIGSMALARSRLTTQGQISVPAKVRQRLGVGPGSVLEWDEDGDRVIVRKAGRYTSQEIHDAIFERTPKTRPLDRMKDGIRQHIRKRHARG
jgi:AbrB family looped-hinge helix DNA binding protein